MRKIASILALIAVAVSCNHSEYIPEFLTDSTIRLEIFNNPVFVFDPLTCQYSCNSARKQFRAHSDNMSDYYVITLDQLPSSENTFVTATSLQWTTPTGGNQERKNIAFEVVKLEGDTAWLWYPREGIKLIVRFL
ncbi:MAG: hypothetical protein MJY43_01645 [Bacteroidales bacterium]|nr:hypothetical protein [Bacteroidales bacterium]